MANAFCNVLVGTYGTTPLFSRCLGGKPKLPVVRTASGGPQETADRVQARKVKFERRRRSQCALCSDKKFVAYRRRRQSRRSNGRTVGAAINRGTYRRHTGTDRRLRLLRQSPSKMLPTWRACEKQRARA